MNKINSTTKAILIISLLLGCGLFISNNSAYAEGPTIDLPYDCEPSSWEDGNGGTASLTCENGQGILTLNNFTGNSIERADHYGINLILNGDNSFSRDNQLISVDNNNSLTISGDGKLSTPGWINACHITINNSTLNVSGISNNSGSNTCDATINNSTVTLEKRISSDKITITNSTVNTNGFEEEALYAKDITIQDSNANLKGNRYSIRMCSLKIKNSIVEISGGEDGLSNWTGDNSCNRDKYTSIILDGGKLSIDKANPGELYVSSGEFSSGYLSSDIIVMDGGKIDIPEGRIETNFFIQNDGELSVSNTKDSYGEGSAIEAKSIIFNGGISKIKHPTSAITTREGWNDSDITLINDIKNRYGISIPGSGVYFNGGDITLTGNAAAIISFGGEGQNIDFSKKSIYVADGMITEPNAVIANLCANKEGNTCIYFITLFTDGNGEPELDDEGMNISHALKTVRIYKPSVPSTDEEPEETEENPNTLDTKIIALAFGTLFAIIAEGAVIADLYRRLFGYKKEVEKIESSEETPNEK